MNGGNNLNKPLILFATPPTLDQLCALTIRLSTSTQSAARFQPQVIKCREFIFTEPEVIGTPSPDINDHCFHLVAQTSFVNSGKLQARISRIGLQVTKPYKVTTELYESCLRYTLLARLSPNWNKAGPWLIQGRDFLTHKGCANAVKMNVNVHHNELFFTLEAAVLKLCPLHVTDLDIIGNHLKAFLTNPSAELDYNSIASDWCFILPSMKRGRIVSISHEIPEDSPFKTYRDLKRHWKNTYGYRLPESEDDINFYQIRFGPQGGKLFTYPEVCLRGRDLQKVARIDPKPILRAFMLEIQSKFPTVCGCPIKLQSKAKFTVNDLLSSGQNTIKNQPNLTNKMNSTRPALYRTKDEMEKMLSSTTSASMPKSFVSLQSSNQSNLSVASIDNNSVKFMDNPRTSNIDGTNNSRDKMQNLPVNTNRARMDENVPAVSIRAVTNKQLELNDVSTKKTENSVNIHSDSQTNKSFIGTPGNASSVRANNTAQMSAHTPMTDSNLMNKREIGSHKLIPQFKPKKLLPLMDSVKPGNAQKIVPLFHPQKKSSVNVSQVKVKSTVNKPFISHTPSKLPAQSHLAYIPDKELNSSIQHSAMTSSAQLNTAAASTPLDRPTFSKKIPLFKKAATQNMGCVPPILGKPKPGKEGKNQQDKKVTKRPKTVKTGNQKESKKAKKLKKAEA